MPNTIERIAFRKAKEGSEVVAVLYDTNNRKNPYNDYYVCYAHVGQHAGCSRGWIKECTIPATPTEYSKLLNEMRGRGYNVVVVNPDEF